MGIAPYSKEGNLIEIHLSDNQTKLSVQVLKALTPFTMAQILVVQQIGHEESMILKVFDPKFSKARTARRIDWTAEGEKEAANRKRDDLRPFLNVSHPESDFWQTKPEDDSDYPGWEAYFFNQCKFQYSNEVACYSRLQPLQGGPIPKFFGYGTMVDPDSVRSINPFIVLLEYIPNAVTLESVDPAVLTKAPRVVKSLLDAVEEIEGLGVCQSDPQYTNFLFAPGHAPTRALIIDFGNANYNAYMTDQDWVDTLEFNWIPRYVKRILEKTLGVDSLEDFLESASQ